MSILRVVLLILILNLTISAHAITIPDGGSTTLSTFNQCRVITNTTGVDIWVGDATSAEWTSFANKLAGLPAGITNVRCVCGAVEMGDAATCTENPACSWSGACLD